MLGKKALLFTAALLCICASATSAYAYDLCIQLSGGGGFVALKSPKIQLNCCPPLGSEVNTCVPLNGVEENGLGGMVTGTGCVDNQGTFFTIMFITTNTNRDGIRNSRPILKLECVASKWAISAASEGDACPASVAGPS
jgi:hypothetical protein